MNARFPFPLGAAQAALACGALLLLAAAPAPGAPQLLVSLTGEPAGALAAWAIAADARILAPGPIAGSLIVRSDESLGRAALRRGALLVTAPAGGCDGK